MENPFHLPKTRFVASMKAELEQLKAVSSRWQLKRINLLLKLVDKLPDEFFNEMRKVYYDHFPLFQRMGYNDLESLLKEPWLLRYYQWTLKSEKIAGQKANLGGKILELIVKNDEELHQSLEDFVRRRHQELKETNFAPLAKDSKISTAGYVIEGLDAFKPVKAVDLVSGGKLFLDFAYLLYNKNTGKVIVVIEGQIKREGAVAGYIEQARKDTARFYKAGFEFVHEGKVVKVKPGDIMIDELHGSKILVRSSEQLSMGSRTFNRLPGGGLPKQPNIAEVYHEFITRESQQEVNRMLDSLFNAKIRWNMKQ